MLVISLLPLSSKSTLPCPETRFSFASWHNFLSTENAGGQGTLQEKGVSLPCSGAGSPSPTAPVDGFLAVRQYPCYGQVGRSPAIRLRGLSSIDPSKEFCQYKHRHLPSESHWYASLQLLSVPQCFLLYGTCLQPDCAPNRGYSHAPFREFWIPALRWKRLCRFVPSLGSLSQS